MAMRGPGGRLSSAAISSGREDGRHGRRRHVVHGGWIFRLGLVLLLFLAVGDYLVLINGSFRSVEQGHGYLAVLNLANDAAGREFPRQILLAQAHGGKLLQPLFQPSVVDGCGMELLRDPGIEADRFHFFHLSRTGPEGQPVERMEDAIIALNLFSLGAAGSLTITVRSGGGSFFFAAKPTWVSTRAEISQSTHLETRRLKQDTPRQQERTPCAATSCW